MWKPLIQLVVANFKTFLREPGALFWSVVFPVGIAGVLGLGFLNRGGDQFRIALSGHVPDYLLPVLQDSAQFSPEAPFLFMTMPHEEALRKLARGEISLVVQQDSAETVFYYDPSSPEPVQAHRTLENTFLRQQVPGYRYRVEPVITQGSRYIDFLIPGLVALGLMNSCLWGIGWSLTEYRIKKLLRRMVATPMRKSTFMLAQMLTRLLISAVETGLLLVFATLAFGMQNKGGWLAFSMLFVAGLWVFSGIAILISSRTRSAQVANGLINAISLPMTLLSGIFFSYQGFPAWLVSIIRLLPLTILSDNLRSVFNEAYSPADILPAVAVMMITGTVLFVAGIRIYRWY
jgi:ABC-type multidrug transport system permease subunit